MFGFMLPTWFLSMWVSNTATTAMMIPIVGAVLDEFKLVKKASHAGKIKLFSNTFKHLIYGYAISLKLVFVRNINFYEEYIKLETVEETVEVQIFPIKKFSFFLTR